MITDIINNVVGYINEVSQGNQMLAAGLTVGLPAAMVRFRKIPVLIISRIKRRCIVSATVDSAGKESPVFRQVRDYLKDYSTEVGSRNFMIQRVVRPYWKRALGLKPGNGFHYFRVGWRPYWYMLEDMPSDGTDAQKRRLTLKTVGFTRRALEDFISKMGEPEDTNLSRIYTLKNADDAYPWSWTTSIKIPELDQLALNPEVIEKLKKILLDFDAKKARCEELGIPHKLVILLHGEPGNGKSTLIPAMARILDRWTALCDIRKLTDDSSLMNLLTNEMTTNKVVTLEDIHSFGSMQKKSVSDAGDEGITLSGILNGLNGVVRLEDSVVVMTTNYIEDLESALVRPGRVNYVIELPRVRPEVVNRYIEERCPGFLELAHCTKALRGCDIGQLLGSCMDGPESVAEMLKYIEEELPPEPKKTYSDTNAVSF